MTDKNHSAENNLSHYKSQGFYASKIIHKNLASHLN